MALDPKILFCSILLVTAATISDLRWRRIPNAFTYTAALLAIVYHFLVGGGSGLVLSVTGLLAGVGLLILPFATGGMGAGDVKLMGALGALLGPVAIWSIFWKSVIFGGLVAIVYLVLRKELRRGLANTFALIRQFRRKSDERQKWVRGNSIGKIPYGVAIAAGTLLTVLPIVIQGLGQ